MRGRLLILVAIAVLVPAAAALGSRIEVGGAETTFIGVTGHDAWGKVTFGYGIQTIHPRHHRAVDVGEMADFRYADRCSRRGVKVPGVIKIRNGVFNFIFKGFIIQGHIVGPLLGTKHTAGPEILGFARRLHDCDGNADLVFFSAPPPRA